MLYCISAVYHDRSTVDWTRWRHKITAQRSSAPSSCIGLRAQFLHWASTCWWLALKIETRTSETAMLFAHLILQCSAIVTTNKMDFWRDENATFYLATLKCIIKSRFLTFADSEFFGDYMSRKWMNSLLRNRQCKTKNSNRHFSTAIKSRRI